MARNAAGRDRPGPLNTARSGVRVAFAVGPWIRAAGVVVRCTKYECPGCAESGLYKIGSLQLHLTIGPAKPGLGLANPPV